jgi:lipopolysaccharide cholinephosphotransferase
MLVSKKKLQEINKVQIEILKAVSDVCQRLNIKFYMIHGSLLGTIRNHKFVPNDDDIDIALHRKDYELFIKEAPKMLEDHYFVQTHSTDSGYPLAFGKVRDMRTTYIVQEARHIKMNHGIYIDVFPIDNCRKNGIHSKITEFKYKLLSMRIASVFDLGNESIIKKIVRSGTKLLFPSQAAAIRSREKLLTSYGKRGFIRISGGKPSEQCMPLSWFENAIEDKFEGVPVFIPSEYDEYLKRIYGDYSKRTLIENKISDDQNIEINACIVDTEKPYTLYDKDYR